MVSKGKKVDIKGRYCQSAFDRTWCVRTHSRSHQHAERTHGHTSMQHAPRSHARCTHRRAQHHGRTQQHPRSTVARSNPWCNLRSHAALHDCMQPAAGPSSYLRSNSSALRSNAHLTQP
jgi:hypothetical protein